MLLDSIYVCDKLRVSRKRGWLVAVLNIETSDNSTQAVESCLLTLISFIVFQALIITMGHRYRFINIGIILGARLHVDGFFQTRFFRERV